MASKIQLVSRILLGLIFFAFGLMGLFNVFEPPKELPEKLQAFNAGLAASGYFFQLLKGTEAVCGLLLLLGWFVPLALVVLAPIVLNIFLVHVFLAPDGLPVAVVVGVLTAYLSFFSPSYSPTIKQLLRRRSGGLH